MNYSEDYEKAVSAVSVVEFVSAVMAHDITLDGSARDGAVYALDLAANEIRDALDGMRER